jgi:hypothetical protein
MNNENNITQSAIEEQERRAVDTTVNILLLFLLVLVGYGVGYYAAMREVAALAGAILD